MVPSHVRFGDRYVIQSDLIKYFYMETDKNTLYAKLKDGDSINLSYGDGDKAYVNCLRNYVYLLNIFNIDYPYWLNEKELAKLRSIEYEEEDE